MELDQILPLISRWLHVIPAVVLVGGTLFLRLALVPAASSEHVELREAVRRRWARLVMWSVLFLLISGLYNSYLKAIGYQLSGVYLTLLTIKILLALFVFYLASVLTGRSETAKRFRTREIFWLNILCAAMIGIIAMAGWMKMPGGSGFGSRVQSFVRPMGLHKTVADRKSVGVGKECL